MGAPQAFSDQFLPKTCFGKRTLKECSSKERDNIVLIDVDSEDYGDVIILDVPESFPKKFKKKPRHVISIDDDDGCGSRDGALDTNSGDVTTSNRCFSTEAADPSTSVYVDKDVNEGNAPVKLSKSKRTYSGKSISRNHYGLSPDSEGSSSESDCSDCELMEGSPGKLREQWEKAFFRRKHDASCVPPDFENEAGTSAPSHSVHDNAEDAEPSGQQSNLRNCSNHLEGDNVFVGSCQKFSKERMAFEQGCDPMEMDEPVTRTHDDCINSGFDGKERVGTLAPDSHVEDITENHTVKIPERAAEFCDYAGKLAEKFKFPQQECDAQMINEVFRGDYSASIAKGPSQDVESDHAALFDKQQGSQIGYMPSGHESSLQSDHEISYGIEAVSSSDQNNIITDRQKIKETEEYKQAMEEELAARQQQLLIQAEEARRLKNRKKAENMRIMMNERRQKQRVEEIRETRKKDEENLNLKERYRVEIKKELNRIEAMCSDMASLLRCLGIHVGGGLYPSPTEVQAAYKRACLKFHPDRMSTTDLRQQVEAEEKFKLISNMKDKFCRSR